ncbi:hypothetical protein E4U43_007829 [Claviceps pusilla]|uniref:Manganese lipoxygenase n=1 Tax=Claviceps pusilla TaxID=123648 RepID=A0A9P7NEA0_9HYPO|nr:hypothetical protein E4U43_007829 [Claviceps pusilla]
MRPTQLPVFIAAVLSSLSDTARGSNDAVQDEGTNQVFLLPYQDTDPRGRANSIKMKQQGILYGPGPDQNMTAYPAGPLGDALWQADTASLTADQTRHSQLVNQDAAVVLQQLANSGGIRSLADYSKLYDGQWKKSIGNVIDSSFYTNQTTDLYFSMQRLALNPFALRRLNPNERLPFAVDDGVARNLTGKTAKQLLRQGRLFYADYRALSKLPLQEGRFSAACEAYFYIRPRDGQWLPLAIKTNQGADLVYTPADAPLDWLFAKILLGQNDAWDTPWRHFASTHLVVELPYLAAQRCMGDNHPILGMYRRFMLNAFSFRQFIQNKLFAPGAFTDQLFSSGGKSASRYTTDLYQNGENQFRANYFPDHLERHGLLNSPFGPPIRHFPFAEDASVIHAAWKSFLGTFVRSHYRKESFVRQDPELACWFKEVKRAGSVDFPGPDEHVSTSTLVDILTHVAYLTSVQHQAMNNNDQFLNALLPANPMAFYKPLPTAKGLSEADIISLLPDAKQAVGQLSLSAAFSRPEFANSDKALLNVFKDEGFYASLNNETRRAAATFEAAMEGLSAEIAGRRFDEHGLCRGAPFIWRALDPKVALFGMTI